MNFWGDKRPLGIFWDYDNCPIPQKKSPFDVCKVMKDFISEKYSDCIEQRFICVCDAKKLKNLEYFAIAMNKIEIRSIPTGTKNLADWGINDYVSEFTQIFKNGVICIISSDINFQGVAKNAKKYGHYLVLLHNKECSPLLKPCFNVCYLFKEVIQNACEINQMDYDKIKPGYSVIMNLPEINEGQVKTSIKKFLDPYDAKIALIAGNKVFIKHSNEDSAHVVIKRLTGCEVLGIKLDIKFCDEENLNEMNKYISQNKDNKNNKKKTKKIIVSEHELENYPDISNLSDKRFGRMSVLKGMSTQVNDNLTNKVKEFVAPWHSNRINPDFIKSVTLNKYSKSAAEKNYLLVESPDEYACETIIEEAKQYLQNGMKWELYYIQECKSMIKGLSLTNNDNLTTYIKKMVAKWRNPTFDPDIIIKVENECKPKGSNEKKNKTLWITAATPEKNVELLKAAKSNIELSGIRWYYSKPKHIEITHNLATENSFVCLNSQTNMCENEIEIVSKKFFIQKPVTNIPFAVASTSKEQTCNLHLRRAEIEAKNCRVFSNLDPNLASFLTCHICTGIFVDPKELNKCKHTFCGKCLDFNKETKKKCNICRRDYKDEDISPPSPDLESLLQSLITICKFAVNGCKDVLPIKSFTFHCKSCKFNPAIKNTKTIEILFESPEYIIKKLYDTKGYIKDITNLEPFEFRIKQLNDYGPLMVYEISSDARVKIGDILFQINGRFTFNQTMEEIRPLWPTIDYPGEIEALYIEFLDPQFSKFKSAEAKMYKCFMKLFDKNLLRKIEYFNKNQIEEVNKNMEKVEIDKFWRLHIIKGKCSSTKLPAWHLVLNDKETLLEFFEVVDSGRVDVALYGKIIKCGWGSEPPQYLKERESLKKLLSEYEAKTFISRKKLLVNYIFKWLKIYFVDI